MTPLGEGYETCEVLQKVCLIHHCNVPKRMHYYCHNVTYQRRGSW